MTATSTHPAQVLHAHEAPVRLVAFGPDRTMVTGDTEMRLVYWRGDRPSWVRELRSANPRHRPLDRLRAVVVSPYGDRLFLCCGCHLLALDTEDGSELWRYRSVEFLPFLLSSPMDLSLTPDGRLLVAFDNGCIELLRQDGERLYRRRDPDTPAWLSLDKHGTEFVGSDGYRIRKWAVEDGSRRGMWRPPERQFAFAYSPAQDTVAYRGNRRIVLWRLGSPEAGRIWTVNAGAPLVAFANDGKTLGFANGNSVELRSVGGRDMSARIDSPARLVSFAFSREGRLWTGGGDGTLFAWDTA